MVKTIFNSKQKIAHFLLFTLLLVFPFGQIIKLDFVNLFDLIIVLIALFTLLSRPNYPTWYKFVLAFFALGLFSWVFNAILFSDLLVFKGFLYLVRIFAYSLLPVFIANFFKTYKDKNMIVKCLLTVSLVTAVFGWIQYVFIPDTRSFEILGWDDHYYRLIGTFLDPAFTAIVLVLGIILSIYKKRAFSSLFLMFTLAFTYSRAGYLSLLIVFLYFFVKKLQKRKIILYFLALLLFIMFLPKSRGGEGVALSRTSTINARILNYTQSKILFLNSPVIGLGLNNICPAKKIFLNDIQTKSHSCFGLDSSILFILATTGIAGFMLFLQIFLSIYRQNSKNLLFIATILVVFVHSFFSNSLFYPHTMAWMGILLGLGGKIKTD